MQDVRGRNPGARVLLLDGGNVLDKGTDFGALEKSTVLLSAMATMRYDALALGQIEWTRVPETIARAAGRLPLLALQPPPGAPSPSPLKPWLLFESGPARIAVIGVSTSNIAPASLPLPIIERALADLAGKADAVILIGSFPFWEAAKLSRFRGIDVILAGGPGGEILKEKPLVSNGTLLAYVTPKGKQILEVRLRLTKGKRPVITDFRGVTLGKDLPADAALDKQVEQAFARIRDRAVSEARTAGVTPHRSQRFAGAQACIGCHEEDGKVWKETRHAHAFQTLVPQGFDFEPECVSCHVTGHKEPDGFQDAIHTPDLTDVQCEACHGAGAAHAADPHAGYGAILDAESLCLRCHVPERTEHFDFATFWKRIEH